MPPNAWPVTAKYKDLFSQYQCQGRPVNPGESLREESENGLDQSTGVADTRCDLHSIVGTSGGSSRLWVLCSIDTSRQLAETRG